VKIDARSADTYGRKAPPRGDEGDRAMATNARRLKPSASTLRLGWLAAAATVTLVTCTRDLKNRLVVVGTLAFMNQQIEAANGSTLR
jgi:hypothetical protein